MKEFLKGFLLRGLTAASGGPIVLAIIYGVLGKTGEVVTLTPQEVSLGILSVTLMAFVVAGLGAVFQLEQLPLMTGILIHGAGLYATYILIYLLNGWLQDKLIPILVFTVIFVAGYGLIWLFIYLVNRAKTRKINALLRSKE